MKWDAVRQRSRLYKEIRLFFDSRGYLETETPVLSPDLIPESAIEVFASEFLGRDGSAEPLYLTPSPEVWMKKLISQGSGSIYQIAKSFRNCESIGRLHNPEFSMLEWYAVDSDYEAEISTCEAMLRSLSFDLPPTLTPPFDRITVEEAFRSRAGIDLADRIKEPAEAWRNDLDRLDLAAPESGTWEDLFHLVLAAVIEPSLPEDRPTVLLDYPHRIATTAAAKPGTPWSQRWELYAGGAELANCYTEEADPLKIRTLFAREAAEKARAEVPHRIDPDYGRIFHPEFPRTGGCAMGLDRLLMLLMGKPRVQGVILFPFSDILSQIAEHKE